MRGQSAPIDPTVEYAQAFAGLRRSVEELQRLHSISPTTAWVDIALASANWTINQQPQWRYEGGRVWLRGDITRITTTFTAGTTLFTFTTGNNPTTPDRNCRVGGLASIAAATPDSVILDWQCLGGTGFRTTTATHAVVAGDSVYLNDISWPA